MGVTASSNGGYKCEFVEAPPKDFECPLCLHVTREPHLTSCCGQHFCQSCINHVLNKPCPVCRTHPFTVFNDRRQRRRVLELKVYCTMKDKGCSWIGELGELGSHLDTNCQYIHINCTLCRKSLQRRFMRNHLQSVCPKRDFTCQYCSYTATFEYIRDEHMRLCTMYPLPCPNDCGIGTVERAYVGVHLSECPLQLVQCDFSHVGCSEQIQRKDVQIHMESNMHIHLDMMSTALSQKEDEMQRKLAEKDKEIEHQAKLLNPELPPVDFTVHSYSHYEGNHIRWNQCPFFYTHYMGAKIRIDLLYRRHQVHIEVWQVQGEFDEAIDWPVRCTVTVQILNQVEDQNHLQWSRGFVLSRPRPGMKYRPDDIVHIHYPTLRSTRYPDVQYVEEDCLRIRADVKLDQCDSN